LKFVAQTWNAIFSVSELLLCTIRFSFHGRMRETDAGVGAGSLHGGSESVERMDQSNLILVIEHTRGRPASIVLTAVQAGGKQRWRRRD
jgi:hypothetical protein